MPPQGLLPPEGKTVVVVAPGRAREAVRTREGAGAARLQRGDRDDCECSQQGCRPQSHVRPSDRSPQRATRPQGPDTRAHRPTRPDTEPTRPTPSRHCGPSTAAAPPTVVAVRACAPPPPTAPPPSPRPEKVAFVYPGSRVVNRRHRDAPRQETLSRTPAPQSWVVEATYPCHPPPWAAATRREGTLTARIGYANIGIAPPNGVVN